MVVFAGALIAGFSGPIIKQLTITPMSVTWIRTMVPTVLFGGWIIFRRSKTFRIRNTRMWLASLLNAFRMYLFFVGFMFATVSGAAIMLYTWPIFASILGYFFLKEQLSALKMVVLLLAFGGIVITNLDQNISLQDQAFVGMLAALGSAFLYASSVILFKSESKHYSTYEIVFFQNALGSLVFLPFFFMTPQWPGLNDWMISIGYAVLIGVIVFNMFFYGLKRLPASTTSMIMYVEFVSAVLLGVFLLGETFTLNMGIGMTLILGATILVRIFNLRIK